MYMRVIQHQTYCVLAVSLLQGSTQLSIKKGLS